MDFRWVAFITLWTMLVGPIMATPPGSPKADAQRVSRPAPAKVIPGR